MATYARTLDVLKRGSSASSAHGYSGDECNEMPRAKAKMCHIERPRVGMTSGWACRACFNLSRNKQASFKHTCGGTHETKESVAAKLRSAATPMSESSTTSACSRSENAVVGESLQAGGAVGSD